MRPIYLVICLMTILCTETASAQEAYVYDTVAAGTYVYDASSTGKLTLVKGSPFKTVGSLIGTNGKFLVTANSTTLFSYAVESNGGIGKLAEKIDTQLYSGSQCGTINSVVDVGEFDHTGEKIYVPLAGAVDDDSNPICYSLQTYGISKTGVFTFKGATEFDQDNITITGGPSLPTITGNGKFAYSFQNIVYDNVCGPFINTFAAASDGALAYQAQDGESGGPSPTPPSGTSWVLIGSMTGDPTDHVAMAVYSTTDTDCENSPTFGPPQLVSATVGSKGGLTSKNTYKNMPTLADEGYPTSMVLDPTGKILAVATGTGTQFFHFDGADPITPFTGVIGVSGFVTGMAWDSDGHLYAQNGATGKMHVYDVTKTSAKELSGSPTLIPIASLFDNVVSSFVVRAK